MDRGEPDTAGAEILPSGGEAVKGKRARGRLEEGVGSSQHSLFKYGKYCQDPVGREMVRDGQARG